MNNLATLATGEPIDIRLRQGRHWRIDFANTQPGARLSLDGQIFELLSRHEFRRADNSVGEIFTWQSACAECGHSFITSSSSSGATPTRRCRSHRAAGRAVAGHHKRIAVRWLSPDEDAGASGKFTSNNPVRNTPIERNPHE